MYVTSGWKASSAEYPKRVRSMQPAVRERKKGDLPNGVLQPLLKYIDKNKNRSDEDLLHKIKESLMVF